VDRPLSYEGRQATYGRRHLLQLVAIKLLQQQGLSLAQVQQALSGQPDERLEAALAQSLGRPTPPPPLAPLYAAGVGPGLTLVVDPSVHADPAALAARVAAFLRSPVR
jgi:DNA-binding transcriptional MerR regulator